MHLFHLLVPSIPIQPVPSCFPDITFRSRRLEQFPSVGEYKLLSSVGQGANGSVYVCICDTNRMFYCIKRQRGISRVVAAVMQRLRHTNVIRTREILQLSNENDEYVYIVMEYMARGLPDGKLDDAAIKHVGTGVGAGLRYLHRLGVRHGDVKPDNVMMDASGEVKLVDLGEMVVGGCGKRGRGTGRFRAPEIWKGRDEEGYAGDVWAFGVCLYYWSSGRLPFEGDGEREIARRTCEEEVSRDESMDDELWEMVKGMLERDVNKRWDMERVMESKWMQRSGRGRERGKRRRRITVSGEEVRRSVRTVEVGRKM